MWTEESLPFGVRIGGVGNLEVIPAELTFLVVLARAWPSSLRCRGFWDKGFDHWERIMDVLIRDILRKLGIKRT